jgi:hypothetical protein
MMQPNRFNKKLREGEKMPKMPKKKGKKRKGY